MKVPVIEGVVYANQLVSCEAVFRVLAKEKSKEDKVYNLGEIKLFGEVNYNDLLSKLSDMDIQTIDDSEDVIKKKLVGYLSPFKWIKILSYARPIFDIPLIIEVCDEDDNIMINATYVKSGYPISLHNGDSVIIGGIVLSLKGFA
ncbi:hypothetical protein K8R66_00855 [bacterium]|nr:hypothetical protein [bacterium]